MTVENGGAMSTGQRLARIERLLESMDEKLDTKASIRGLEKVDGRVRRLELRFGMMLGVFLGSGVLSGSAIAAILKMGAS